LITSIQQNPKAKFVTRAVQFFAQPLTYRMLSAKDLAGQVKLAQKFLAPLGIPVTVSELAYGYQTNDDAQLVLDTIDFVDLAMLPYFNASATTAYKSWVFIQNDLTWITDRVKGKKIILSENSWPHEEPIAPPIPPATTNAVASWEQMEDYFSLLDFFCTVLKQNAGGGVGWFAHVYSTDQDASYGILVDEVPQFSFNPLTSC
jgi:exo-beta-1,3-glucanase (GH17 family)